jgi:hypothetical protein
MPDLISWLLWACIACGPLALVLYWRDRHARAEHRNLLAAAIAQRDGALARASDAEDAFVLKTTGTRYPALAELAKKYDPAAVAQQALPATHPQRRRRR